MSGGSQGSGTLGGSVSKNSIVCTYLCHMTLKITPCYYFWRNVCVGGMRQVLKALLASIDRI